MPIESLLPPDSPRLSRENIGYARALAELEVPLPPVLVHRSTMRIIDGTHRLLAAALRGRRTIDVRFFDGSSEDAFVLAVQANIAHGLPLTLEERTAAAARILRSHPTWSNRAIALVAGLSAKTVGAIRQRPGGEDPHLNTRVGRDGKVYRIDTAEARQIAGELLTDNPNASLREVARAAGISPSTVRDVRDRLCRGENPVPERAARQRADGVPPGSADHVALLDRLRGDPSLRLSESGRVLLRLLSSQAIDPARWAELGGNIPPHCRELVAEMARGCAKAWHDFAGYIDGASADPDDLPRLAHPG
ncbi:ParB and winged helix-turn-helix domain-containing protein [Actinokineospora inagensis]|uniref:ParB and winged helix-turn-helix domain-containing protein n=1 Tax=Actinokineospora inagensis TaxID=103730 RepID=UPI00040B8FE1|nr:winged helix-turn-helix transcriptional regulator [Actinokineospora inagensis]